jgi:hypothetical protein
MTAGRVDASLHFDNGNSCYFSSGWYGLTPGDYDYSVGKNF